MHQFPKFTTAWNSTCFGQFLYTSSGVYSLYTRHWCMSYKFEDSWKLPSKLFDIYKFEDSFQLSSNLYDINQCRVYRE